WSKVFTEMEPESEEENEEAAEEGLAHEGGAVSPHMVRKFLERQAKKGMTYVILDEFDKIADDEDRRLTADTIKLLSDRAVPATLIVIGVSDDVTGLISDHRSIERCLTQVPMRRMPLNELEEIVSKGLAKIGMQIDPPGLEEISGLSKGLPHYTHLLSLHAARQALDEKSMNVSLDHVRKAVKIAVEQSRESIRREY